MAKKNSKWEPKSTILAIIFYLLISFFFLRGVLFSSGIIQGGDWGFPLTFSQADQYFKSGFYTWTDTSLFGIQQFFLNGLPFQVLIGFLAKLGITGDIYTKLFLILAFVFAAFNMFLFCRFLGCIKKVAFFGGLLYITLPFFFNYAAMGWLFVLFSMGILPLVLIFFIKSVKEEKVVYSILTGVLYFLAIVQSQSLIWYPLVFLCLIIFLVKDKRSLLSYVKSLLVVFLIFFSLNAYLWLPLFLGGGSEIVSTKLGLSTPSLGTWSRLSYLNILRLWGSLFNYQYETSYPKILTPLSLLLPFLAFSSLIFIKKKKILLSFAVLAFVTVALFTLGPNIIVKLPFSDIFRDMARFLILPSFSYVVMVTLFLDFFFKQKKKYLNGVGVVLIILLIVVAYPFWAGELFGKQKQEYDVRLRTYNFPPGYFDLEDNLKEVKENVKVLYFPIGGSLNLSDDKRFYGPFKQIQDIFANYSPKPGVVGISDKGLGSATDLSLMLTDKTEQNQFASLDKLLSLMAVKYIAVRENAISPLQGKTNFLEKQPEIIAEKEWDKVSLLKNNYFLPHFYIPQNIIYSPNDIEILPDIVGFDDYEIRSAVFVADNALNADNADKKNTDNADEENADNAGKNTDNALNADKADEENTDNAGKDADNADKKNADKADEENADNTDKRARITRIEGADEIFVKGENKKLGNSLASLAEIEKLEIFYPHVKHEPGSLKWEAALLKEKYDKWRARKEPEKLLEKHLFYANKRINELKEFYADNADIKDADNADKENADKADRKNTDNTDKKRITLIEMWEKDLEKAIGLLEKIQEEAKRTEWAIKIKRNIKDNKEKLGNSLALLAEIEKLEEKLDEYIPKLDIGKREYEVEIPRAGNYSLLIKGIGNEEKLGNSLASLAEIERLEIDGEKIADNALNADNADIKNADNADREDADNADREDADNADRGADKADRNANNTDGGWRECGEINLEEGKHILTLKFGEIQNLLKYAPVGRNMVAFGDRNSVATQPEIKKLEIDEWQEDQWYQVKGKYEIENGEARLIIEERKEKEEEKLGNSLASLAEIEKLEKFEISKEIILTAEDEEFEFFIKADPKALAAQISLVPSGETKIILEDLRVEPVWEPEIFLRSKNADNADIKNADNADRKDADNTDIGADKADEKTRIPKITFVKINPTKYRIKVEGAKEPYTLVFSESFHEGWRLYADNADIKNADNADKKADKADEEDADNTDYGEIVASYFDGQIKEGTHRNTFLEPATFETWGKEPIAQDNHLLVNGYANSWYITPNDVDGAENYELIVEFWPQRLFYIGLFISGLTLVGCLGYLTISRITRIKRTKKRG